MSDFPLPGALGSFGISSCLAAGMGVLTQPKLQLLQGGHTISVIQACGRGLRQWAPKVLP